VAPDGGSVEEVEIPAAVLEPDPPVAQLEPEELAAADLQKLFLGEEQANEADKSDDSLEQVGMALPGMVFEEEEKEEEDEVMPPPQPLQPPPSSQGKRKKKRGQKERAGVVRFAGLSVECWALPSETEVARLDRVVGLFLEKMQEAGAVVPTNFQRVEQCGEPQHDRCYTYSFGTRRLHISTREGEGGRLSLVVRCGGGFLDFIEFVRRNGAIEELRLQRLLNGGGESQRIRLAATFVNGKRQIREV